MKYTSEDLTPVKKKFTVTVPQEEAEAAISAAVAMYRTNVTFDGFRKGKVPSSMIEQRFHDAIYGEATTDLVNVHINEIVAELKLTPISRIDFDGGELERGKEFVYSFSFEVMPEFKLPTLEKIKVEQGEPVVDESEVDGVIERLRMSVSQVKTVDSIRNPKEGDIAVIDFSATDENGNPVEGVNATDFSLPLGEGQSLEGFEQLIMSLKPGENGEGPVTFPAEFFNPEFAGKTFTMRATLKEIKERILPEADDEFAKKHGNFDSITALRDSVRDSYVKSKTDLHKSAAQKKILDKILVGADFPLPESMVISHVEGMVNEHQEKLARQGVSIESTGKTLDEYAAEIRPEAELRSRTHIFLLTAAKELNVSVTEQEVDLLLRQLAAQHKTDYNTVKEYYEKNNLMFALRDRLLCDKAMDTIYDNADITFVPEDTLDVEAEDEKEKKSAAKKAPAKKPATTKD